VVVKNAYRIKEVAERSGFSPATLRYYEEIGILPQPERTDAGYRRYDDHVLERLAFIARAKQLGCTLDEIAELTIAWDGGRCGPVQDRLRELVADKVHSAQAQIAELMTLTADLQRAAQNLEAHRPDGPCDDSCGCTTSASEQSDVAIPLIAKPASEVADATPITCTLSSASLGQRLDDWHAVLDGQDSDSTGVRSRRAIDGGIRLDFDDGVDVGELARLAAAEQDCCRFFAFAVTVDARGVGLEVRAPGEAADLVHAVFGTPA
jgi:MerR family transcriptional regulator, copper efflux regulator